MKISNLMKLKQLGMPIGTASGKLKKAIMLKLLQKLKEDICYRCNKIIETPEELSIDHKINWLHVSSDLFWDLDNIAFSHKKCNKTGRYNPANKLITNNGTSYCPSCKLFLDKSEFHIESRRHNKCHTYCKKCRKLRLNNADK